MKIKHMIVIGICLMFLMLGCVETGQGTATDSVARVSYTGLFWKTYKVELTNDHPISDGSGGTISQQYGIAHDDALISKLHDYADSGKRVKLSYRQYLAVWPWEYSNEEVIYDVQEVEQK